MRPTPTLRTARLVLRRRTPADAEALFPAFADVEAMRYWSCAPHANVEETHADFARNGGGWRVWAITPAGSGTAIGFVAAGEKRQGNVSELGYMLARAHWGRGFAGEAVSAVIDRVFAEGQRRVFADTDPDNAASRALLERLGFRLEGLLRAEWETHIGVRDTALYGLLPADWSAARAEKVERARRKIGER
ncbi:GNAT family N-acetyltransferase [Sphingomonas spermidinifaciens]|uniref:GNAT family N-acetyltransferase n=1 Tax=Sphingomonas spermidinifaciens TaxID=1141889 RepID=A0A2A4AXC5_9SPHN|nr:GNAT family protein [Sphingomonas spermidinifaciens]PCD01593.1 GNAT family N-acetyltransferase [Sphingomonas spermidinifaciens]